LREKFFDGRGRLAVNGIGDTIMDSHDSLPLSLTLISEEAFTRFDFTQYHEKFLQLCQYTRTPLRQIMGFPAEISKFPDIESSFLYLGFRAVRASLMHSIRLKLKKDAEDWLALDALRIAEEEKEFDKNSFDKEMTLERVERLYRVRLALENPLDKDNNHALGLLAERSGSKFYWRFFLGALILEASMNIVLMTRGVAVPYLMALADSVLLPVTATASAAGTLGIMWWQQQKPCATALCCFWHMQHKALYSNNLYR
jgi:hypothetical protein